ncbi:unnamed protein product [Eruca vesicaria subsp. sativa]|uniref:RRM domain-containing protein n=1 Tax=Eruca vesicaria subsp. sativa TaxID=29727 RepID=A0ABC8LTZ9_ERUVS|nr:unnamed protein product [Eruca vesicaria subsp. sativa]
MPRVVIAVEGYDTCLHEDDVKKELINHFNSCGEIFRVVVPKKDPDCPNLDRRAFVILLGDGAKEKALQLNGTDMGGWIALVKVEPDREDEESAKYRSSLIHELMHDPKFLYGVTVSGYDTSLTVEEVESALTKHFMYCGEITHIYVNTLDKLTNIYFSKQEEEARAMDLRGTKVGGFKLTIFRVATVLSNRPLGNGERGHGYTIPAHMIEFTSELNAKVIAFKKERGFRFVEGIGKWIR